MTVIRTCPWCGSDATLIKNSLAGPRGGGYPGYFEYYVRCENPNCMATAPLGKFDDVYQDPDEASKEAIAAWNHRDRDGLREMCEYGKYCMCCTCRFKDSCKNCRDCYRENKQVHDLWTCESYERIVALRRGPDQPW